MGLGTQRGRLVLAASLAAGWAACLLSVGRGEIRSIRDHRDLTDHRFYRAVAARVGAGAGYYDVVAVELGRHGFPSGSPFNWRTPLYAHALGRLGGTVADQVALATLATIAAALAAGLAARELGTGAGLVAGLSVAVSSAWWGGPEPPCFTEAWAGLLILAAIAARGLGFVRAAVAAGALALFLRELALPFVGLCLVESWARRRARESAAWGACLLLYAAHLAGHIAAVAAHRVGPADVPATDWVGRGGIGFVLATARMNYALSLLPDWCAAIYLPLAIYGLVGLGRRLGSGGWTLIGMNGYLLAFTIVGRDFNWYWGWITAPTLALGAGVAPFFLADSVRAVIASPPRRSRRRSSGSPPGRRWGRGRSARGRSARRGGRAGPG